MPADKNPEDVQAQQRAAAREAARREEREPLTETEEGGRYMVDGEMVNAEGEPLKKRKADKE